MEVWEAAVTLAFIPVVVFASWYAEQAGGADILQKIQKKKLAFLEENKYLH